MKTRHLNEEDYPLLHDLHNRYFGGDFSLPNFHDNFIINFAITNDFGRILVAGGVRPIAETIIVTDKSARTMEVGRALREAIAISQYACNKANIEWLHAFVKDNAYKRHLIKWGFNERLSTPLSMKV